MRPAIAPSLASVALLLAFATPTEARGQSVTVASPLAARHVAHGSDIGEFVQLGAFWYFAARTPDCGQELWRTDGTAGGTTMVRDIRPGSSSSSPAEFLAWNGHLYFAASDPFFGRELWRTDGTAAGTVRLTDIGRGMLSSSPSDLAPLRSDNLVFAASGPNGRELWLLSTTSLSMTQLADIHPSASSNPTDLCTDPDGGLVYFCADDGTHGREPWVTSGLPNGTTLLRDVEPGAASSDPADFRAHRSKVVFAATTSATGREPWRTNGTTSSTRLIKDIRPGPGWSNPDFGSGAAIGNRLYFSADDGTHGTELWSTNNWSNGTVLRADLLPGSSSSYPAWLAAVGNTLYLSAQGPNGDGPWLYEDGAALQLATDIAGAQGFVAINGRVLFSGDDGGGHEPFTTQGTVASTQALTEVDPTTDGGVHSRFVAVTANLAVFVGSDGAHWPGSGPELWATDATWSGSNLVLDIDPTTSPGTADGMIRTLANVDDQYLLYGTIDLGAGATVYRFDALGEQPLADHTPYDALLGSLWGVADMTGGAAAFSAPAGRLQPGPTDLCATDGTVSGTVSWPSGGIDTGYFGQVAGHGGAYALHIDRIPLVQRTLSLDFTNGTTVTRLASYTGPDGLELLLAEPTPCDDLLFYAAATSTFGGELRVRNQAGTITVIDIVPGAGSSDPHELTCVGTEIVFLATTPSTGTELWASDGTMAGTTLLTEIVSGASDADPTDLVAHGTDVYFTAEAGALGRQLHRLDLVTRTVTQLPVPGVVDADPAELTPMQNRLFFVATTPAGERELHMTDGTTTGTGLLIDLNGSANGDPANLTATPAGLMFAATDIEVGREPFVSDGSAPGTHVVADVQPGAGDSGPSLFTWFAGGVYFQAFHPDHGAALLVWQ